MGSRSPISSRRSTSSGARPPGGSEGQAAWWPAHGERLDQPGCNTAVQQLATALRGAARGLAQTLPGRQTFRGALSAAIDLSGLGNDIRSLQGRGKAHVTEGDFGELPIAIGSSTCSTGTFPFSTRPGPRARRSSTRRTWSSGSTTARRSSTRSSSREGHQPSGQGPPRPPGQLRPLAQCPLRPRPVPSPGPLRPVARGQPQILVVRMLGTLSNPKFTLEPLPQFKQMGAEEQAERGMSRPRSFSIAAEADQRDVVELV